MPSNDQVEIIVKLRDKISSKLSKIQNTFNNFSQKLGGAGSKLRSFTKSLSTSGISLFTSAIKTASSAVANLATRAKSAATSGIKKLGSGLKDLRGIVFNLKSALLGLGLGLIAKNALNTAASFERMKLSLDTVTKGGGEEWFRKLNEWALKMPVNTEKAIQSFIQLRAMGLRPTIDQMTTLVDTMSALGGGSDTLQGISRALGQIQTKGKVSAEELMQLAERGVPVFEILREKFGDVETSTLDATEAIAAIFEGLNERFGGQSFKMQETWAGMVETMISYWKEFTRLVAEAGVFNYLKAGLSILVEAVDKLKADGGLEDWSIDVSNALIRIINFTAKVGAGFMEIFHFGKRAFEGLLAVVNTAVGAVLKEWEFLFAGLAKIADKLGMDEVAEKLNKIKGALGDSSKVAFEEAGRAADKTIELADEQGKYWNKTVQFLDKVKKKAEEIQKTADARKLTTEAAPTIFPESQLSDAERNKSEVRRLKESSKTALAILEAAYDNGKIALDKYYNDRKAILERSYNEEIALYKRLADEEKDKSKRQELLDKSFQLQEQYNQELVKLDEDRIKKQEELEKNSLSRQAIINGVKKRNAYDYSNTIKNVMEQELADLDYKHQEELKKLRDLNASKAEEDELYRQQKIERDKLLLDQEKVLFERRQELLASSAGSLKEIFSDLYTVLGEDQKEFFYLAKAAALAEAIINTSQAITKAMAQGGYLGIAQAAIIGAKGAVEIAKISAQSLAEGGLVLGKSPNSKADDKMINATSGEFMMQKAAVDKYGVGFMSLINNGMFDLKSKIGGFSMPSSRMGFAEGGLIGSGAGMNPSSTRQKDDITIVNFTDPTEIEKFLATDRGQRAIFNTLSSNPSQAKRIIQRG